MYEIGGLHASARDSLVAMGHTLLEQPVQPGLMNINGIMRAEDGWHGLTQPVPSGIPAQDAGAVGF